MASDVWGGPGLVVWAIAANEGAPRTGGLG